MEARMANAAVLDRTDVQDVSIDDFTTGWIAGLARLGVSSVRLEHDRFYRAIVAAFDRFVELCQERGLRPRFVIQLTEYYWDAPDFRNALQRATARGLLSLDNPDFINIRLKYSRDDAHYLFRYLEGGALPDGRSGDAEDLYVPVARAFRQAYASSSNS
jgi:hypothetical protein